MQKDYGLYGKRMQIDRVYLSCYMICPNEIMSWMKTNWQTRKFSFLFFQEENLNVYKVSTSLVPVKFVLRDSVYSFLAHTRSSYVSQSLFLPYLLFNSK